MWKFNRLSYKCMLVIALSTSAVLYMTIPGTANAMKGDFADARETATSRDVMQRVDQLAASPSLPPTQENVFTSRVAVLPAQPAPFKVGLGRTCDDPWWELSGIQFITCLLK